MTVTPAEIAEIRRAFASSGGKARQAQLNKQERIALASKAGRAAAEKRKSKADLTENK